MLSRYAHRAALKQSEVLYGEGLKDFTVLYSSVALSVEEVHSVFFDHPMIP